MPCIGTGLDQLDCDKVKLLTQETFRTSPVQVVVYILPDSEIQHRDISGEEEPTSKFAQAQEADESLKHVRRWVGQKIIPTQNDLQGLPRIPAYHGKGTINWAVYKSKMALLVVNLSPRMVV